MTLSNYYSKRREDLEGNQISRNFRLEIDSNDSMNSEKKTISDEHVCETINT